MRKQLLKKLVQDGMGGGSRSDLSPRDLASLAPLKNAYYKRQKAAGAYALIAKLTRIGAGIQGKYPKSRQEAIDQMAGR